MSNLTFEKFVVFSKIGNQAYRMPIQVVTIDPAATSAGLLTIPANLLDLTGQQHFTWRPGGEVDDQYDASLVDGQPYFKVRGKWDPAMTSPRQVRTQGAQGPGQIDPALGGAAATVAAISGALQRGGPRSAGPAGMQDLTKSGGGKVRRPQFEERLHKEHDLHEMRGLRREEHRTLEFRVPHRKKDRLQAMLHGMQHTIKHNTGLYVTLGKLDPAPEDKKSLMSSDSFGGLMESGLGGAAAQGGESAAMLAAILGGGAILAPVAVGGIVVVVGAAMTYQAVKMHRENLKQQLVFCRLTTIPSLAGTKVFPWEQKLYDIGGMKYHEYTSHAVEGSDLAVLVDRYISS